MSASSVDTCPPRCQKPVRVGDKVMPCDGKAMWYCETTGWWLCEDDGVMALIAGMDVRKIEDTDMPMYQRFAGETPWAERATPGGDSE